MNIWTLTCPTTQTDKGFIFVPLVRKRFKRQLLVYFLQYFTEYTIQKSEQDTGGKTNTLFRSHTHTKTPQ